MFLRWDVVSPSDYWQWKCETTAEKAWHHSSNTTQQPQQLQGSMYLTAVWLLSVQWMGLEESRPLVTSRNGLNPWYWIDSIKNESLVSILFSEQTERNQFIQRNENALLYNPARNDQQASTPQCCVVVIALYREENVSCETPRVMPHFTSWWSLAVVPPSMI